MLVNVDVEALEETARQIISKRYSSTRSTATHAMREIIREVYTTPQVSQVWFIMYIAGDDSSPVGFWDRKCYLSKEAAQKVINAVEWPSVKSKLVIDAMEMS